MNGDPARETISDAVFRPSPQQFEPERRCPECGAKLTVQILPHGLESHCTPCERRARGASARDTAE